MPDSSDLERQIEQRLAVAKAKHVLNQGHLGERMEEIHHEQRKREQVASRAHELAESVIWPRIDRLISYFDNAEMLPASQTGDECRVGSFRHTERFPATSKLEFTVHPDAEQNKICVTYRVEILPIFFDFEREDELVLSADVVDEQIVNSWVERKILQFVDSYLKLQEIDPYQQENLVTDPVCGMRINKTSVAGEAQYKGQTYYFCVEECRRSFLDDPQRYVKQL